MASRRGIPPKVTQRAAPITPVVQKTSQPTAPSTLDSTDSDGFGRFYANLTSGPFSKLSSMLAFPGLPLMEQDEPPVAASSKSARVSQGPDPNQIFSKAALNALHDQKRHPGHAFGPHESFYVIPPSGGTTSYASILSKGQEDEFVDAKEVQRDSLREEELQIENAALKQILDKLSHRLQAFESHAQDASMHALSQSMASIRGGSTSTSDIEARMRAMEAQLEREMKERERLGLENQKNKQIIAKYRSHWEQLKDSARARERDKSKKT